MRRKNLQTKMMAAILSASMVMSLCPTTVYAAEETAAETVEAETEESQEEAEAPEQEDAEETSGEEDQEESEEVSEDTSESEDADVSEDVAEAEAEVEQLDEARSERAAAYTYVYAGLTWEEYWKSEDVYNAGSTESSDVKDQHDEYDKGAFDTVTRATTNHGLHRGSFQCMAQIDAEDDNGNAKSFPVSHWSKDGKTIYLTDGSEVAWNKGELTDTDGTVYTMTEYEVTGMKYIPVKVKTSDYNAFKEKYQVVENGGTLVGGYAEGQIPAYELTADVDEDTNGLKTAVKNKDGSFSFTERQEGTDSGVEGEELEKATDITVTVKPASGSYGEFLRVDLTGAGYGALGAKMYATKWTYYGDDSTYSKPLVSYGTKFAADNWMHKAMGIQLGLTDSYRCQLPEGYYGNGYWELTVYAMGYEDYTVQFKAEPENIVSGDEEINQENVDRVKALIETADGLDQDLYDTTAKSWTDMQAELAEAKEEIAKLEDDDEETNTSNASLAECYEHLNSALSSIEGWALMNIPYNAFYAADLNNAYDVDAFSSATLNKSRTNSSVMAAGSYHVNADGTDITGITFPVKITGVADLGSYTKITDADEKTVTVINRGQANNQELKGKEVLFESPSYAYYALGAAQDYYKELTVSADGTFSFGKTVGEKTVVENAGADFTTETTYGDYQLNLTNVSDVLSTDKIGKIYGVIISTEEGSDYGLRHVENVWQVTKLAWSTGFTAAVHGCPTSSQHYEKMMGQHINAVTYYTDKGIYEVALDSIYVPVKFAHTLTVADADVSKGSTTVKVTGLPKAYQAEYTVLDAEGEVPATIKATKNKITFDKTTATGTYTLKITDKSGVYADLSTTFEIKSADVPAAYDEDAKALTAAEGKEEQFAAYLAKISAVTVNGTSYAASGRGAVVIVDAATGAIKTDAKPIAAKGVYDVVVKANGYADLAFTYVNAGEQAEDGYSAELTSDSFTYTGSAVKPGVKVTVTKDGKTTVVPAKSYSVSYKNNVKAGTATAVVKGKGAYKDLNKTLEFTIAGKSLADSDIVVTCADMQAKNGKELTPKLTVKYGKLTLKANTDYTVSYDGDRTAAGTVTVTITGKGNYAEGTTTEFRIYEQSITKVKVAAVQTAYTGRFVRPELNVTVKNGKTTTTLTKGVDYIVSYSGNLNAGTGKAMITGIGEYGGTKTVSFKIAAKSLADESVTAEVKDASYTGKAVKPSVVVKDGKTVLKAGVDYTVTYKNNTKAASAEAGKKAPTVVIKGKGNYAGQITKTFTISAQ